MEEAAARFVECVIKRQIVVRADYDDLQMYFKCVKREDLEELSEALVGLLAAAETTPHAAEVQ